MHCVKCKDICKRPEYQYVVYTKFLSMDLNKLF